MAINVGQRKVNETESTMRCYAVDASMALAEHTIKNCSNENHFDPKYRDSITQALIIMARDAYVKSYIANKIRVTTPEGWQIRKKLQLDAIYNTMTMVPLINLARRLNHLRRGKTEHWIKLSIEARDLLKKWHAADVKRYEK